MKLLLNIEDRLGFMQYICLKNFISISMYLTCKMHLRNSKGMFKDSKSVIITCIVPMCTFCYLSNYLTKFSHD